MFEWLHIASPALRTCIVAQHDCNMNMYKRFIDQRYCIAEQCDLLFPNISCSRTNHRRGADKRELFVALHAGYVNKRMCNAYEAMCDTFQHTLLMINSMLQMKVCFYKSL